MSIGFFRSAFILSWVLLGILLTSCAQPKKVSFYPLIVQSQEYLKAGDFQKAIDTCQATYEEYPEAQTVLDNYIKTIQEIKASADGFFKTKDFVSAMRIYSLLSKNSPRFQKFETSLPFTKGLLDAQSRNLKNMIAKRQALRAFEAGDSDKAIEVYSMRHLENPDDADWLASFISILEDIKRTGDGAFSKGNFALAGQTYFSLFKNFKSFEKFETSLSFSKQSLDERMTFCRKELHKKALEQYRKEHLAEAISIWQSLLTFDPDNVEAKKAIQTATILLNKIKQSGRPRPKDAWPYRERLL